jgi:hypothetical protein
MAPTVALSTKAFVTKQEIREALFVDTAEVSRTDDELNTLYNFINWVSAGIESFVGSPIIQRSYTEYSDGGGEYIFLTTLPVVSVTTVTERGIPLTAGTDFVYDSDLVAIRRLSSDASDIYTASTFDSGTRAIAVTYIGGYGTQTRAQQGGELTSVANVPEDFKMATYIWVQSLWEKGPANYSPEQGNPTGSRAAIPYAVKEILRNRVLQVHWIGGV